MDVIIAIPDRCPRYCWAVHHDQQHLGPDVIIPLALSS
jgi:hypothetical protein